MSGTWPRCHLEPAVGRMGSRKDRGVKRDGQSEKTRRGQAGSEEGDGEREGRERQK